MRLLDAAVSCLTELGYAGATVTEIARRAGTSLGSLQYHFPSKADLLVASLEHLFERRRREHVDSLGALPDCDAAERAVELLWETYTGPTFHAYLELVIASRTDAELRPALVRTADRMAEDAIATYRTLYALAPELERYAPAIPSAVFALFEGLAVGRIGTPNRVEYLAVLAMLKDIACRFLVPRVAPDAARVECDTAKEAVT